MNATKQSAMMRLGFLTVGLVVLVLAAWLSLPTTRYAALGAADTPTATPACPRLMNTQGTPAALGSPTAGIVCS